jgi:hypothetical protein
MNSIPVMAGIAFAIVVFISVALTLSIEGAGALFMRDQIRAFLERTRATIPAHQPNPTEDARVPVLR